MIPPGRLTAMPSAIVSAVWASIGFPASIEAGNGAQAAAWTPTIWTSGRAALIASATPAHRPPPPTGMTTFARSGTSSSSSRPSEPWPATIAGSSNGCTNARPPVLERSRRGDQALVDAVAADVDRGAGAAGGLDLGHRRVGGDEDLARDAHLRRGRGQRLAVVAGARGDDAVVAPVAQRGELGRHAADLEGAGPLQVLGLEHDRPTRALAERAGGQDRRAASDLLDRRSCGGHVARGDSHSAMMASISTSAPIGSAATPIVVRAGGSDGK